MKIQTHRNEEHQKVKEVVIYINDTKFICKESFDNLQITKIYYGDYDNNSSDLINIQPRSANQIDIY